MQEMKTEKIKFYFMLPFLSTYFYSLPLYLLTPLPLLSASSSSYYISFVLIPLLFYYQVTFFPRDKIYVYKIKMACHIPVFEQL